PASLNAGSIAEYTAKAHDTTVTGFLLGIIPDTLVSAFTQGNILQVLMVAILFGISMALVGEPARPLLNSLERISIVVFRMVG
ncbi:cation:dicarboxylase symporter family transporter, partial [Escherichia coli]